MKVTKAQAAQNRDAILQVASKALRRTGFEGLGVADVARQAQLTHGALYRHFESKEALLAEACAEALAGGRRLFQGMDYGQMLDAYLSETHRDCPEDGCAIAALAMEVGRQPADVRKAFASGVEAFAGVLQAAPSGEDAPAPASRDQALFALAAIVGAVALARATAEADPALSEAVFKAVKTGLRSGERQ